MTIARRSLALSLALVAAACGDVEERGSATREPDPSAELPAASDPRFAPRLIDGMPALILPGSLHARFDVAGAHIALSGDASAPTSTIVLTAIGRGDALRAVPSARAAIEGPEVRLVRDALPAVIEWWRALPSGLEHGVTITERPEGSGGLVLELTIEGELRARSLSDDAIALVDQDGRVRGRYASLVVVGSDGAEAAARMQVEDGRVRIEIDDTGVSYPLVIDPLVTTPEATLLAPERSTLDYYGHSVALSSDGSRALVGAMYDGTPGGYDSGSAHVLVRTGASWVEEQMLLAPEAGATDQLGSGVSLTADGTRALVGAYGDYVGALRTGSARVFVRSGSTWTQEQILEPVGGGDQARFGASVSISADGTRAIVGSYWADTAGGTNAGTATVFSRSGSTWTLEQTLVASGGAADRWFGFSVALTSDGERAIVGVPFDFSGGSARTFVRSGTTWTEEATLRPAGTLGGDGVGRSVSISSDGSRVLVGAWTDDVAGQTDAGSACVFSRSGSTWSEEALLVASGGAADDLFGRAVSLSADGNRALVGANGDDTAAGSARVFVRAGTTWTEDGTLVSAIRADNDDFGFSVALAGDGKRALVGARGADMGAGSARVFTLIIGSGTCSSASECASDFCVDDVCCDSACGGGVADCQACSVAMGGTVDGVCTALSVTAAEAKTCRVAEGDCDVAETCSAASTECPPDAPQPAGHECGPASGGECDRQQCDGVATTCPTDVDTCEPDAGLPGADAAMEMPDAQVEMPDAQVEMTDAQVELPDAQVELPDAQVEMPDAQVEMPDAQVELPDAQVELPDAQVELPDAQVELPDAQVELPDAQVEMPDAGNEMPDGGNEMPDAGMEALDAGIAISDAGMDVDAGDAASTDDAGLEMPDAGFEMLDAGFEMLDASVDIDASDAASGVDASGSDAGDDVDAGAPAPSDGCSCRVSTSQRPPSMFLVALVALLFRRSRRARASRAH